MRTDALIIKKQHVGEYDQQIVAYTQEFGKITAVAKSSLKIESIQGLHLDVLNLVNFDLILGRGFPIISAAQIENGYSIIKDSLVAWSASNFFLEIADRLIFENEKDVRLWNFLIETFNILNQKPSLATSIFRKKQMELLEILGYSPQIENCTICRITSSNDWFLSSEGLGFLCSNCFLKGNRGVMIKKDELSMLKESTQINSKNKFRSAVDSIFESILGARINSLDFFYQNLSV